MSFGVGLEVEVVSAQQTIDDAIKDHEPGLGTLHDTVPE